ncbi:MAG: gamma-butyrobetaine hydroxylase-like domain-containing protein, partial [bacterium]
MSPVSRITDVSLQKKGIFLSWDDGEKSFYHYVWLRDCCYCEDCGDSYSSNRYLVPCEVELGIEPQAVRVTSSGDLEIEWCPDNHQSNYKATWLRRNRYDESARKKRFHQPNIWSHTLEDRLPSVIFESAQNSDSGRFELYRQLRDYGFVIVKQGPKEPGSVEQVAGLLG